MSSKSEKVEVTHSKQKNKLSSKRQKLNFNNFYDLNVISALSGSTNRNHERKEENVCRINSSQKEKNQMTSTAQMNFRGELFNSDTQFKTSALEDSLAEIFVSKNKPENVASLNNNDIHHVNNISESTNHEKENVVKDNSLSCPLCWKSYNEKELFLGHIKICGNKHNKSAKWLLEALQLQERQKAEREALGLPNLLHIQPNKKKASTKRSGNAKGDTNLQLALALSASMKDAEDIERLDQEQCLLELGIEDETCHQQQQNTLEKFCFTSSRPVLVPLNPRAKNVNKNGNYVLLKRMQVDRENILSEKVTRLLAENEKVTTKLNDDNGEIIVSEYLQKFHRKDDTLWHKACGSSEHSQQDYYTHKLTDFIPPCEYTAGSRLKYIPQCSRKNEVSEIKYSAKRREAADVKVVESSSGKTPSTSTIKSSNTLTTIFVSDWKCMLNKKAFSDITIFVDKGKRILAHKLIFHARCPLILKDIIKEETSKNESQDMLMWLEIPYSAALAFLEYVYCSSTNKIFTLRNSELASLRKLLQRYHVRELLAHLKLAKSMRTKSSSISQGCRRSLEEGGYLNSESPVKKRQCSNSLASLSANSSNTDDALITPGNEEMCNNASIRSESPDLFKEENSENILTDNCHVKDRLSQESSRVDIDFLVSLLDKSPSGEQLSFMLNSSPKTVSKQVGIVKNTGFKSPYKMQKLPCTNNFQNNYSDNLEMEHSNENWQRQSIEEKQLLSSSPKKNNTEAQISPNNTIKPFQEQDLQKTSSPLKTDFCALSSLPDSDAEYSNEQSSTEIVFKPSDFLEEEHFSKDSAENSHIECVSPQIIPKDSFKKHIQAEIHKMSVSEQEKDSRDQSSFFVESSLRNSSRSSSESPNYAYIKRSPLKSKTPHEAEHKLEHLSSGVHISTPIKFSFDQTCLENKRKHSESSSSSTDTPKKMRGEQTQHLSCGVHSSTPIKFSFDQTCLENERKHSESASSSTDTPKKMRGEQTHVEHCEELKAKALDASTVVQNNTDSDLREQLDISLSKNNGVGRVTCSITFEARGARELNDQDDERGNISAKREGKSTKDYTSDKEWDSFDEICCASPAGIFSLPLTSHLRNKTPLKENKTTLSQGTPHSSNPTTVANSFIASLNESFLWREENAPEALCKTPQNTRMADDVTPPIDYNILRTAEIKKELRKYGLKPSLTKKQARTMLQYIYDQLHPWISDAEETSSSVSTQPEFKLPCNSSPIKLSCGSLTKISKDPVKRSLLESCSQQDETGSESDSELPLSQQSFSSTSSALSEIITAEEIHSDVQEDNFFLSQEVLSAQELKIAVHRFILSNQDLHQKILLGEPIVINDLHATLKSAGFKCKMDNLMDYLDEQCITFRTLQQGSRRRKASKNMTKKTKYIQKNRKKRSANSSLLDAIVK